MNIVHAEASLLGAASDFMIAISTRRLSLVVLIPTCDAGHAPDLIFCTSLDLNSTAVCESVSWSDHYLMRLGLGVAIPPCRGDEHIYAHPQKLMDPDGFQSTLQDSSSPVSSSLNELTEIWNRGLQEVIKGTAH